MANSNKIPIIICVNDRTGKTSLTPHFNLSILSSKYHMPERSTHDSSFPSISKSQIKLLDKITSGYTWDLLKSFKHYNKRFHELAYYYGYPILDYKNKSGEQMSNDIDNCVVSELYDTILKLKLVIITHGFINTYCIENLLVANFNKYFGNERTNLITPFSLKFGTIRQMKLM